MRSPMVDDHLRSLAEKPICEGVWPYLDAMDTVRLRTVSMEWNMPEKYGPHGVLLFFASKDEHANSSSENNVGNSALFVIGLHGSGDVTVHFLQDGEVAKVALSCHLALGVLCQEVYEVERRRGWFRF